MPLEDCICSGMLLLRRRVCLLPSHPGRGAVVSPPLPALLLVSVGHFRLFVVDLVVAMSWVAARSANSPPCAEASLLSEKKNFDDESSEDDGVDDAETAGRAAGTAGREESKKKRAWDTRGDRPGRRKRKYKGASRVELDEDAED